MGISAAKRQQGVCFDNGAQTEPMEIYSNSGANAKGNK